MFFTQFFKSRTIPIFVIGGTNDLFVPFATNAQWVFDNTDPPHYLAKLVGGTHIYFTDYRIPDSFGFPSPMDSTAVLAATLSAYGDASECRPLPPASKDRRMSFATQHTLVVQLVTAFLDAEMRQRPAALQAALTANNPRVIFRQ
jgi:predicted dienelactone hydrolase